MATWHQAQRSVPLWHDTLWTVVEDAGHTCISRFQTSNEANGFLTNLKHRGKDRGAYILPPMQHQMSEMAKHGK